MTGATKRWVTVLTVVALASLPAVAGAVRGFDGPLFGLTKTPSGDILVADASVGIIRLAGHSVAETIALPGVTDMSSISDTSTWAVTGAGEDPGSDSGQALYRVTRGKARMVANLFDFEKKRNPDGHDPPDSNPYDVEALGARGALVIDAGGNDLLRVDNRGRIRVLAVFPSELVSTDNLKSLLGCPAGPPDLCGLPDMMPAEAVPTSVAIGPDGYYYVGELKGFPAPTGESNIWRVSPDASGAQCGSSPDCVKVFDGGFTSIIDLAFNRDGTLHVAELDEASWAAVEILQAPTGGTISSCDLNTLTCGEVATGIPILTSITFGKNDTLWATKNALIPGAAEVVRIS